MYNNFHVENGSRNSQESIRQTGNWRATLRDLTREINEHWRWLSIGGKTDMALSGN